MGHNFNFDGGEYLRKIAATWFVSYSYYLFKDKSHLNWKKISTAKDRISVYNKTAEYHKFWMGMILNMNNNLLNRNHIKLDANETKKMAMELLHKSSKFHKK